VFRSVRPRGFGITILRTTAATLLPKCVAPPTRLLRSGNGDHAGPQEGFAMTMPTALRDHRDFLAIVGLFSAGLCNIAYFIVFTLA